MTSHDFTRQEILDANNDRELSVQLPVEAINLLTQVRRSMTDIEELAESIRTKGQMTQGFAVALEQRQAAQYLREINEIRQTEHSTRGLTSITIDGTKYFVVLVAGHRRYLALRHLLKTNAKLTKKCNGQYRCILRFGMSARAALEIQFQENRHKQVPLHEEAAAAWDFYIWQKQQNPSLTLKEFGQSIGRSPEWVRTALRFCSLPDHLQKYASGHKGVTIPYGILAEAARLAEGLVEIGRPIGGDDLENLVIRTVLDKTTVAKFRKEVSARLMHIKEGQKFLFDEGVTDVTPVHKVVAPHLVRGFMMQIGYLRILERLMQEGMLQEHYLTPQEGVYYSTKTPVRLALELVDLFGELLPGLEKLSAEEMRKDCSSLDKSTILRMRAVLHDLTSEDQGDSLTFWEVASLVLRLWVLRRSPKCLKWVLYKLKK